MKKPRCLPNGLSAYGYSKRQNDFGYGQILGYFRHGIEAAEGITVIDVGANVGLFALEMLHRTHGNVTLYCIEPAPMTYAMLEKNVKKRFSHAKVNTFCCGLSSKPGQTTLYFHPYASSLSSLNKETFGRIPIKFTAKILRDKLCDPRLPDHFFKAFPRLHWLMSLPDWAIGFFLRCIENRVQKTIPVLCELKTLSQLIKDESIETIDLLKIDVEGAEWDVLQGIEEHDWPKIQSLVAELHDREGRLNAVRELLEHRGFSQIVSDQEFIFQGTDVHSVFAHRHLESLQVS
jgi:FkbM family methyltransferase